MALFSDLSEDAKITLLRIRYMRDFTLRLLQLSFAKLLSLGQILWESQSCYAFNIQNYCFGSSIRNCIAYLNNEATIVNKAVKDPAIELKWSGGSWGFFPRRVFFLLPFIPKRRRGREGERGRGRGNRPT